MTSTTACAPGCLTLEMLESVALPATILKAVRERYPALDAVRTGHELMRRQITIMVEDVIATASAKLARLKPQSADEVRLRRRDDRHLFRRIWRCSEKELKAFLYKNMYRADEVMRVRADAEHVVRDLFDAYFADPREMPEGWREGLDRADDRIKARDVADFLAGMTDTYALKEHRRLFDHTPDLS